MLSNREIKWIQSLKNKKYRHIHGAFIAEGPKLVDDLINNGIIPLKICIAADNLLNNKIEPSLIARLSEAELRSISSQVSPNGVLAVFQIPANDPITSHPADSWGFAFEHVQDPGNLGTILRTMDWLGIDRLYCSLDTVDLYNPKVVQASMGSIGRLQVRYVDLPVFLQEQTCKKYAADMDGKDVRKTGFTPGIILLGNEGNGISADLKALCDEIISIPRFGQGESLNVAMTAGLLAGWIRLSGH